MGGVISPILSKTDFIDLFRPLVGAEDKLADLLLLAASERLRRIFAEQGKILDEQSSEVRLVLYEVVSAVLRPGTFAGLTSVSFTTDDAVEQRVFANPSAACVFTEDHYNRLGLDWSASPRGTFFDQDY